VIPHLFTALLAAATLGVAATAWAAVTDQAPTWVSLSKPQQEALAPLQRDWASIEAPRKQKWLEVAGRFPGMPEAERNRVQQRMAEWARMTPGERTNARLQFQETRQFSPEDRQARWEAYKALPDDERQRLAQRALPAARAPAAAEPHASVASGPKRNIVSTNKPAAVKPVAPTVVQAKPGATTTLMSARAVAPAHQQPGLPKIAATEGFVNPTTLLPRRGPQGAAVSASASEPAKHP
jgi:hypothetical protein